jgi:hypothetical protein
MINFTKNTWKNSSKILPLLPLPNKTQLSHSHSTNKSNKTLLPKFLLPPHLQPMISPHKIAKISQNMTHCIIKYAYIWKREK